MSPVLELNWVVDQIPYNINTLGGILIIVKRMFNWY